MAVAGGEAGGESGKGGTDEVSLGLGTVGERTDVSSWHPQGHPGVVSSLPGWPLQSDTRWVAYIAEGDTLTAWNQTSKVKVWGGRVPPEPVRTLPQAPLPAARVCWPPLASSLGL